MPDMNERDLLRDYAREHVLITKLGAIIDAGMTGELAGKAIVAIQNVLDVVEHSEAVNEVGSLAVSTDRLREEIRKAFI